MTSGLVGVDNTFVSHAVNDRNGIVIGRSGLIVIFGFNGGVDLFDIGAYH